MTIYMVRHGECNYNSRLLLNGLRNSKLTEKGENQARECAQKLKNAKISVIYSSPLRRAFATARIIANELKLKTEIIVEDRLQERDFGILTGKPVADIPLYAKEIIKGDKVDYFLDTQGAENYDDVYGKVEGMLEEMKSRHNGDNIGLVTHGAVGQVIRAAYYGWPWRESFRKMLYFDNNDVIELNGKILKL